MPYQIEVICMASRQLRKLSHAVQAMIGKRIDALALDPRPEGCVKLSGMQSTYRVREGDYRVIYQVKDQRLLVLVLEIGHRREVYR